MPKLPNIQILRALAALLVVLYHCAVETTRLGEQVGQPRAYDFFAGSYGVQLFFLISGFIMVVTTYDQFQAPGAAAGFAHRRIVRIVPLYWTITTLAIAGVAIMPQMLSVPVLDPAYIASSYLFWPVTRVNGLVRPIANLGWTLNIEMMFYAVFTVGLMLRRPLGIAATMLFLAALSALQMTGLFAPGGAAASVPLNFWGDPIILGFILGMGVGVAFKKGLRLTAPWLAILAAAFVASTWAVGTHTAWLQTLPENHLVARLAGIVPSFFLFAIAALGRQVDAGKRLWRAGLLLGDASYSLYLIHPFALRPLRVIWAKLVGGALPIELFFAVGLVVAVAVGLICYGVAERPLTRFFSRRRATAGAVRVNAEVPAGQ